MSDLYVVATSSTSSLGLIFQVVTDTFVELIPISLI